jgi:hypothetical protein
MHDALLMFACAVPGVAAAAFNKHHRTMNDRPYFWAILVLSATTKQAHKQLNDAQPLLLPLLLHMILS